jgi:hypothetical protein
MVKLQYPAVKKGPGLEDGQHEQGGGDEERQGDRQLLLLAAL